MSRHDFSRRFRNVLLAPGLLLALVAPARAAAPHHERVVVVVMENKSYDEVRTLPYTASLLAQGATLSNSVAVRHPSQPNYFALWGGNTLGITNDNCPAPGSPFSTQNLGQMCETNGLTWRAYSENLGAVGSTACSFDGTTSTGLYTRKHDPWTYYQNVNHLNERPYTDLAVDIAAGTLPNLVFIIPNNCHNTHNSSTPGCGLADGDTWLAANLPAVIAALGPTGLLVLTWDEDDSSANNHILTALVGPLVIPGAVSNQAVNHYTVVRMICEALGFPTFERATVEASIVNVWKSVTPTLQQNWGRLKASYR
ncbi:MAG TPA: alkaline phosphatase family protein [Methylomirabilota bacterium]|nr:alkaline phosphatase family protein [Methylomirabilota bacterium]